MMLKSWVSCIDLYASLRRANRVLVLVTTKGCNEAITLADLDFTHIYARQTLEEVIGSRIVKPLLESYGKQLVDEVAIEPMAAQDCFESSVTLDITITITLK